MPAVSADVYQAGVLAAVQVPADDAFVFQAGYLVAASEDTSSEARVTQAGALVAVRGRTNDPKVRVWTYTLDGHDFLVMRLGNQGTLVYDTHSDQFSIYGSDEGNLWRAYTGTNWLGGYNLGSNYGSNIVAGDDGNGALYFLAPAKIVTGKLP